MNTKTTFFEGSYVAQMLGPLFLIPVLMLAGKYNPAVNADLLLIAGLGLLLCASKQIRGCAYALILLALSATIKHLWFDSHHAFQACLESCVAFSLIITSLVFTEAAGSSVLLQEQMDKKAESIEFLEEDLAKQREKTAEEAAIANHKLTELQGLIEETQNELSALQMLNEVLRKTTAKAIDSGAQATSQCLSAESRAGLLLEEIDLLQRELNRLSNESMLVQQNGDLFKELNAARFKSTQTHLINETLARMLANQTEKTQELEQLQIANRELEQKLAALEAEKTLQEQMAGRKDMLQAQENLSKRLTQYAETEALYRQLREQFAQKDAILHQTRSQLFHAETELQRLEKQAAEKQLQDDPLPPALRKELETIEDEKNAILEENHCLTDLISHLMAATETPEKKK